MLKWAIICLLIAIVAAFFGFGLIATGAALAAKAIFFVFIVLFVLMLVGALRRP